MKRFSLIYYLLMLFYGLNIMNAQSRNLNLSIADSSFNDYLPLAVGNKWQYLKEYNSCGSYSYSLEQMEITGVEKIGEYDYYIIRQNKVRYDREKEIIYVWHNNQDNVHLDFNAEVGDTVYSKNIENLGFCNLIYKEEREDNVFGNPTISRRASLHSSSEWGDGGMAKRYSRGFGQTGYSRYANHTGHETADYSYHRILINAIIYREGEAVHYTLGYKPQFENFNVTANMQDEKLSFDFYIEHELSRSGMNYNKSIKVISFYGNNGEVIDSTNRIWHIYNNTTTHFSKVLSYNTALLDEDWIFYFKLIAMDESLVSQTTCMPECNYFKLDKSGSIAVGGIEQAEIEQVESEDSTDLRNYCFNLYQNYPNPFNPQTTIKLEISKSEITKLVVYNLLGQEVTKLVNAELPPGEFTFTFPDYQIKEQLSSGIYIYTLTSGSYSQSKKMIFIK